MPRRKHDLHGNVPDEGASALLVLDVINDFEFAGTDKLLKYASAVVPKLTALKVQARAVGIPAVCVNDNFGRWTSDFRLIIVERSQSPLYSRADELPGFPLKGMKIRCYRR